MRSNISEGVVLFVSDEKIISTKDTVTITIGRVVMIPNEFTVVIEKFIDAIHVGDDIIVYENSEEIISPDGVSLGRFSFAKVQLKVVEVQEMFCVCQDQYSRRGNPLSLSLSPLFSDIVATKSLPIPVNDMENMKLELKNPSVSIGDLVKYA